MNSLAFSDEDKQKFALFIPYLVEGVVLSDFNWYHQVFSDLYEIKAVDTIRKELLEGRFRDSYIVQELASIPEPELSKRISSVQVQEAWNLLKSQVSFEMYTEWKDFLIIYAVKMADASGEGIFSFLGLVSRTSKAESRFIDHLEEILS